jgi:hypothetical protein
MIKIVFKYIVKGKMPEMLILTPFGTQDMPQAAPEARPTQSHFSV